MYYLRLVYVLGELINIQSMDLMIKNLTIITF